MTYDVSAVVSVIEAVGAAALLVGAAFAAMRIGVNAWYWLGGVVERYRDNNDIYNGRQ